MESERQRPRSIGSRGTNANARVPTSPVVTRGSAPEGTFQIPEGGLHVPKEDSFLSRFRANRLYKLHSAAPSAPGTHTIGSAAATVLSSTKTNTDPNSLAVDEITVATSSLTINASERSASDGNSENVENLQTKGTNNYKSTADMVSKHSDNVDPSNGSRIEESRSKSILSSLSTSATRSREKTPEQVADEAEDTLIEIVSQPESLLSETRPSYPVLRFCAGNCLVDQKAVDHLGVPLGFIWCPFGEMQSVNRVSRLPKRCGTCGSFVAKGNGGEEVIQGSRVWTCGFCGRNDNDAGEAGFEANVSPQGYPEFSTDTVEYLHPRSATGPATGRGAIVLIVDENLEPEEADWARAAAAAVRTSASERRLRFALLTVGAGCSVAVQSSDAERAIPTLEMMSVARASKLTPEEKTKFFLDAETANASDTNGPSAPNLGSAVTDVLITPRQGPEILATGSIETGRTELSSTESPRRTRLGPGAESRRLDIALFVAFELILGMADSENSRILSLITGPPTLAQHALRRNTLGQDGKIKAEGQTEKEINAALTKLYEQAGSRAGEMRIALDFLCFGAPQGFGGPILLGAAKRSRGGLLYTAAHSFSSASSLAEAATFLAERSTSPGVVSIRVSSPLIVGRVIGPAFPTAAPHTYAVPGIDPLTGFTIMLKSKVAGVRENDIPSSAVVQLAAKSLGVTRVVTARIPVTTDITKYLESLDAEISALVIGKACLISGGALTQPRIAARSIDVSVERLLRGSEALMGMARLLYELRRGLLLERHVNSDCALVLRSFFLWTECGTASLLMSPRLFTNAMSDESTGLMAEVPLEKKYVTKDAVVVLDTGFNVFVYVGAEASPEAEEAISDSARSVAAQRLSPCQLWKMRPGRDADYVLDSYLSPSENLKLARAEPFEQGFLAYCIALAPDAPTVVSLRSA